MKYDINKEAKKIVVTAESYDDLWAVNNIIQKGDILEGHTKRRFRVEGSEKSEKKDIWVKIEIEKKEFSMEKKSLKFTGKILEGKPIEYVDEGSYQSLDMKEGTTLSFYKKEFFGFEENLLRDAKKSNINSKIIAIVIDDDVASIAEINNQDYKLLSKIHSENKGKRYSSGSTKNYYKDIFKALELNKADIYITAGPGFEKEKLKKYLKEKKINALSIKLNSSGETGIIELMKSASLSNILSNFKIKKDLDLINNFIARVSKGKTDIVYGKDNVFSILDNNISAIETLIVTTDFFNENFSYLKKHFISLSKQRSKIHIIDSKNNAGKQLDGIGGIALFLYYSI